MINLKSHRPWLVIIYLIVMFSNSIFSFIYVPIENIWKYDKVIHFIEFFILGVLLLYALYENPISNKNLISTLLVMSIIPILDESIQFLSPHRVSSIYDALADYLGFYSGCSLYHFISRGNNG